jgi:hypothetical protein
VLRVTAIAQRWYLRCNTPSCFHTYEPPAYVTFSVSETRHLAALQGWSRQPSLRPSNASGGDLCPQCTEEQP